MTSVCFLVRASSSWRIWDRRISYCLLAESKPSLLAESSWIKQTDSLGARVPEDLRPNISGASWVNILVIWILAACLKSPGNSLKTRRASKKLGGVGLLLVDFGDGAILQAIYNWSYYISFCKKSKVDL